jgi:hypothetical protein
VVQRVEDGSPAADAVEKLTFAAGGDPKAERKKTERRKD